MPKYLNKCPVHTELDIYKGCPFNCIYCISHQERRDHSFDLQAELTKIAGNQDSNYPYYLSPWTDAYQPIEAENGYSLQIIKALAGKNRPFFVITKSLLVERDVDYFKNRSSSFIAISLNTLDDRISAIFEPGAPVASERKALIERLVADKSLKVVIKIDPIIPGITDGERLENMLDWLENIKPEAVTADTLRISSTIVENMHKYIDKVLINNILQHYPKVEDHAQHPNADYRLKVLQTVADRLKRAGVKAAFCRASLPQKINGSDCRGGYNYDY